MIHDFHESLAKSHKASDLPIWEQIYTRAFPGYLAMVDHRADGEHQRAGIDRSVILANSKQILIDEKARFPNKNGYVYEDILLEYVSVDRTGAPGWVCKPMRADYIAYAIVGLGICYMLPVIQLQLAWLRKGDAWRSEYPTCKAPNNGYMTLNCPVPVDVLFPAIGSAFRVRFDVAASVCDEIPPIQTLPPVQIVMPHKQVPAYQPIPLF